MPHALAAGRRLASTGVVVGWETAGTSNPKLIDRAVDLSLQTRGCIKFELKAFDGMYCKYDLLNRMLPICFV